ncbi:Alpha/Beta hydrolase protein [Trichoderma barbatum]
MPFFERNNQISIWFMDEGSQSSPPILLIPGLTCDLHDWSWQVKFLLDLGFRVISFDIRGQGRSSAPAPTPGIISWPGPNADPAIIDYFPETRAYDIVALLKNLSVTSVIVISHSQGALESYYLATVRPDLVRALITLDPVYQFDNAFREANASYFEQPSDTISKMIVYFEMTYSESTPGWQKTWHIRRAKEMNEQVMYAMSWGGWGTVECLGRKETAIAEFGGKLKCPRLTIGSNEHAVAVDRNDIAEGSELDECVVIEGKGHWFHQLASDEFNSILRNWLEKIGALPV